MSGTENFEHMRQLAMKIAAENEPSDHDLFVEYWKNAGVKLPNPEHSPKEFEWYVRVYLYVQSQKDEQ